jgi:hypothetical protein
VINPRAMLQPADGQREGHVVLGRGRASGASAKRWAHAGGEGQEHAARGQRGQGLGAPAAPRKKTVVSSRWLTSSTAKNPWVMATMPEMAKEIGSCTEHRIERLRDAGAPRGRRG